MCIAKRSFHQYTPFPFMLTVDTVIDKSRGTGQRYISSGRLQIKTIIFP